MKRPTFTNQFQKDKKLAEKRGKDLTKIKAVMFDIICEIHCLLRIAIIC